MKAFIRVFSFLFCACILLSAAFVGASRIDVEGEFYDQGIMNNDFSYSAESTNYSSVTIHTPNNSTISAYKYTGNATPTGQVNLSLYPSAELKKSASYYYNCHGFTFYFCGKTTGITNAKAFWIQSSGISDCISLTCNSTSVTMGGNPACNELVLSNYRSKLHVGDIIMYKFGDGEFTNETYSHSAVVKSISSSGVYVYSKWGENGVYRHKVEECPYALTSFIVNGHNVTDYCKVLVLRPKHFTSGGTIDNSVIATNTNNNYYLPAYEYVNTSTHKKLCNCGRCYKTESHNLV